MMGIDFDQEASVMVLPQNPRQGSVRTVAGKRTLRQAIRLVVEDLPRDERFRALIRATNRSLHTDEIEAMYAHSLFENRIELRHCA